MNTAHKFTLKKWFSDRRSSRPGQAGFTLVELLVVIGTIGLLAVMLLPALAGTRTNSQAFQCLNNTKRLTLAWLMYASDNKDRLMSTISWVNGLPPNGSYMDWTGNAYNYNTAPLTDPNQSLIASYIRSTSVFKCPADNYQSAAQTQPRARSYSMNAAVGPVSLQPAGTPQYPIGRVYPNVGASTMGQLNTPGPAQVWVVLDEHPDSNDDGMFHFRAGALPSAYVMRELPGSLHNGACGISFADGHSEIHQWVERGRKGGPGGVIPIQSTIQPVMFAHQGNVNCPYSDDYAWLNSGMPYR